MPRFSLNFAKMNGLIPVVIQDYQNNEVLMVGFMNKEAWKLTLKTGKVYYYSRKKRRLWMKGEESKHYQYVKEIYIDNDNDSLLIKVNQIGGAVEDGYRSCFYRLRRGKRWITVGEKVFDPKKVYKNYSDTVFFVIPCGSLYASTILLLTLAGYKLHMRGDRSYQPKIMNDEHIKLVVTRAQEIPKLVESGEVDIGLTGIDLVEEEGVNVTDLADLGFNKGGRGKVLWVLAVPKEKAKNYTSLKDFQGKKVATELINTTKRFFVRHSVSVEVMPSIGSTESKAPFLADAIVDLAETGGSLKDNGLTPLYLVQSSTNHLIAHNHSMAYGWKRRKIEEIVEKLKKASKKLPKNPKHLISLPSQ